MTNLVKELREARDFIHNVTGSSKKRCLYEKAAKRIEELEEYIESLGEQHNHCTRLMLGRVCTNCDCGRNE